MKSLFYIVLLSSILYISCGQNFDETSNPLQEETPETLTAPDELVEGLDIKVYRSETINIVDDLFQEALAKNKSLDSLYKKILLSKQQQPTLGQYYDFIGKNNKYYREAGEYINNISDSIVRKTVQNYFNASNNLHLTKSKNHQKVKEAIQAKKTQLKTLAILIRLFTTEKMIRNYQQNELPKLEDLKALERELEQLIEKAEEVGKPLN